MFILSFSLTQPAKAELISCNFYLANLAQKISIADVERAANHFVDSLTKSPREIPAALFQAEPPADFAPSHALTLSRIDNEAAFKNEQNEKGLTDLYNDFLEKADELRTTLETIQANDRFALTPGAARKVAARLAEVQGELSQFEGIRVPKIENPLDMMIVNFLKASIKAEKEAGERIASKEHLEKSAEFLGRQILILERITQKLKAQPTATSDDHLVFFIEALTEDAQMLTARLETELQTLAQLAEESKDSRALDHLNTFSDQFLTLYLASQDLTRH